MNGYFSERSTSPAKGYVSLYDCQTQETKRHKNCEIGEVHGITVNTACPMNEANKKWADQLSMYLWMAGMPVGSSDHVVGIDQFVGKREKHRIAIHRSQITPEYQVNLFDRLQKMWEAIQKNEVIPDPETYTEGSDELRDRIARM